MRLRKIISGGQTGADLTGLEVAKELGLETGGMAPKGWKTDEGPNPLLGSLYGLVESMDERYPPRTRDNVRNSNITLWFGNTYSKGYWCTKKACYDWGRDMIINPTPEDVLKLADEYEVFNVAGNRARTNPTVVGLVREAFKLLKR